MFYSLLADIVVVLHLSFIIFVILGGLLVIKQPKVAFFHIPAIVWGALIEFANWICPLTPLENKLRILAGQQGYSGDFIGHYLESLIYPDFLSREIQIIFGLSIITLNIIIYFLVYRKLR